MSFIRSFISRFSPKAMLAESSFSDLVGDDQFAAYLQGNGRSWSHAMQPADPKIVALIKDARSRLADEALAQRQAGADEKASELFRQNWIEFIDLCKTKYGYMPVHRALSELELSTIV